MIETSKAIKWAIFIAVISVVIFILTLCGLLWYEIINHQI